MKKISPHFLFLYLFLLATIPAFTQVLRLDSIQKENGTKLDPFWKYHDGDNALWSASTLDDGKWDTLKTEMWLYKLPKGKFSGIAWFRFHFMLDSIYTASTPVALVMEEEGASEIYVDGNLVVSYGHVSNTLAGEIRYEPVRIPAVLNLTPGREHVIAIRYSNHETKYSYGDDGLQRAGFTIKLVVANDSIWDLISSRAASFSILMTLFGFFIALGIVHLLIYLFYKSYRSNLYYFIFISLLSYFPLGGALMTSLHTIHSRDIVQLLIVVDLPLFFAGFLAFIYSAFYPKFPKQFWIFLGVSVLASVVIIVSIAIGVLLMVLLTVTVSSETIRVTIVAVRAKKRGARILGLGAVFLALFVLSFIAIIMINRELRLEGANGDIFIVLLLMSIICLPLCMSIHLAREFAQTNRSLSHQLKEVEILSAKTIEQEKEKQKLLETEKDRLEIQVRERTAEISDQKKIIEEKNKDITDSILYAKKIQDAMLPASDVTKQLFPEIFILFRPKDIVSGDFYWIAENNNSRFIAAADCTGHGVPGALMSMTGNNFLNQIVLERNNSSTAEILTELDFAIRKSLKQERADVESKDGMDIALCRFTNDFSEILFSGANRPLWIMRGIELMEFKGDKRSIGGIQTANAIPFSETKITLQKKDCIYIFSDGFADQFGGPEGKKFMTKRLKELLVSINPLPMAEQKLKLEDAMNKWRGEITQVDDLLVIGIRV